jgi:hypothetical protein
MRKQNTLLLISILAIVSLSYAQASELHSEFRRFNKVFLEFFKNRAPKTVVIKFYANWEINYPAASTERSTDYATTRDKRPIEWSVSILSGYLREELGGLDVHMLVMCHEMAHHLGGKPYKLDDEGKIRWASMEPQADYWATQVCIPAFLKQFPEYLTLRPNINPEIKRRCAREFHILEKKYQYCLFSSQAALQLAKIHQKYKLPMDPDEPPVSPSTPNRNIVEELDRNNYPNNQCRFDSSFFGALSLSRPTCWFPRS